MLTLDEQVQLQQRNKRLEHELAERRRALAQQERELRQAHQENDLLR